MTPYQRHPERDYIARTIATVRNHKDADNCWPQWANVLADEIERLDAELKEARERIEELEAQAGELQQQRDVARIEAKQAGVPNE